MSQQQLQGMDMLLQGSTVGQSTADQAVQQSLNATGGPGGDAMTAAMFQAATAGQSPAAVQQAIQQALQANMGQGNIFAEIMRGGAADPTTALQQSLSGQINLDAIQPQLESAAQRFNQELNMNIMPQIQSQAVSYGGLGGSRDAMARGIAGGLAGQELARVQGDLVSQEMQRALTRQHEAGMGMTDLGVRSGLDLGNLQLQGAQIGGNLGLGQGQLGIAGAETLGQIGADFGRLGLQGATTALSGAPIQQQLALTPGQTMMGIGEQMQQQDQAQRLALQAAFDEQQWAPIDRLTALQPFGTYGFQQQQVRNPSSGQQAILGALGGASAGAGIYSALGATGAFAPWLAIPAALGGVAGLFD